MGKMGTVCRVYECVAMAFSDQGVGWGEMLLDFIVWERKIFGLQPTTLDKRFYDIRFIHVTEGYGDISLMEYRVKDSLKAVKLRGAQCKKVPPVADLLRWIYKELNMHHATHTNLPCLAFGQVFSVLSFSVYGYRIF